MTKVVYKYVDDINRLLADLWESFPSYQLRTVDKSVAYTLSQKVLNNLKLLSTEMCLNFEEFLGVNVEIGEGKSGSFGQVGPLYVKDEGENKRLTLENLSFA